MRTLLSNSLRNKPHPLSPSPKKQERGNPGCQDHVLPERSHVMLAGNGVNRAILLVFLALWMAGVACSSLDDVIGQRNGGNTTPTVPVFATATPGGRISVWLTTPTGQPAQPTQSDLTTTPTATPPGEVVAPAVTATAAYATLQAATATAGAPQTGPIFQPDVCPPAGGPPPPIKPQNFSQYPEKIGLYLSAGAAPTLLEATLRNWGALGDGAVVQADTDLTGNGVPDVIVTLYDPAYYRADQPSPGQMLIFGCFQKAYKLLYATPYSPTTIIPVLHRVGSMGIDPRADVAYTQETCTDITSTPPGNCTQVMQIISYNAAIGGFVPLNDVPMDATNALVAISDLDRDGIFEVEIMYNVSDDPAAGPPRRTADIWDWNGINYVMALKVAEPAVYRFHVLNDADAAFDTGDWKSAVRLYDKVHDDDKLLSWTVPNETPVLQAYAIYKKILALLSERASSAANNALGALQTENPTGSPGEVYVTLAQTFMDSLNQTKDRKKACAAVLTVASGHPEALATLNSFGTANRSYTLNDLCPLGQKQ